MEETEEMISIAASAPSSVRSICATTSPAQCSSPSNIIALDDDVDLAFARELEDCIGESAAGVPPSDADLAFARELEDCVGESAAGVAPSDADLAFARELEDCVGASAAGVAPSALARLGELPELLQRVLAGAPRSSRAVCRAWSDAHVALARARCVATFTEVARLPVAVAGPLEAALFAQCGARCARAYRAQARRLVFNLRCRADGSPRNAVLRARVLSERADLSVFAAAAPEQLAPTELSAQRAQWCRKRKAACTRPAGRAHEGIPTTGMFRCDQCGGARAAYAVARRGPAVDRVRLLVRCLGCGHRWEQ